MSVLLDTCVLSEAQRPKPDIRVIVAIERLNSSEIYFSVITIGEIVRGITLLDPGHRRSGLEAWLREIETDHRDQVLPVDSEVARLWGHASAHLARQGVVIADADILIAATALRYELPVMTRNVRHFRHLDVQVIDPWSE